ncbi:HAD-IIB family hydrolase [Neptunicella sp. SCSIO 80796]|uniref:HAD-IIB family hydrolase n=1 Tax=Neptunicella plasticusilytica TaxID=3117012 RepID=UPI003A4E17FF
MLENRYVIFTDLDGSLLDHDTYSHSAADQTLAKLHQLNIPVIPNTSKTAAELEELHQELALDAPFIVENGAAVFIPKGYFAQQPDNTQPYREYWVKTFSKDRQHWLTLLAKVKNDFKGLFEHFATMTVQRICDTTGLSFQQAELAADRHFSEPVLWQGDGQQRQQFIDALIQLGADPLQGGRFIHVSGECSKGIAMQWLVDEFSRQGDANDQYKSIAIGDSQNDVAMLEMASIAVRILSPVQPLPELNRIQNLFTSTLPGPEGWSECIEIIMQQYFRSK